MRVGAVSIEGQARLVVEADGVARIVPDLPADPLSVILDPDLRGRAERGARAGGERIEGDAAVLLPPIPHPGKIICVGLNYADHAAESPYDRPDYPVYFLRVETGLIGHGAPLIRPRVSEAFDFEGEMVAVIGRAGRAIPVERALDHVVAYSVFNDGSIRDYQFKGPQWTLGKNFDGTGAFGPYLVPADAVPKGGEGLAIRTRLNGEVVQEANTRDLIFPLPELIARVSEAMTLRPGDIIVTGTPAGVGFARKPPLFMKDGDVCEVEVEGIGLLRNPVRDEAGH